MKIQIICENCNSIVELVPETLGNLCYTQSKLNDVNMQCSMDVETSVTSDIDEIKEMDDVTDIDTEYTVNSIRFTCNNCGHYIELTNLE